MSRYGRSSDDLAYGDYNRWDRDRFDRFGRGPPQPPEPPRRFEEDFRFSERDRPGRRDIAIDERTESRGPRGSTDERERIIRETYGGRRRTDKELFGNVDPRELADMAVAPYKGKRGDERELDITIRESRGPQRPGMLRRQSSLDTFDRRPQPRYDREENRLPAYTPIPLPVRRRDEGETFREIEVKRERSVHRRGGKKSRASSVSSSSSSSISTVVTKREASPVRTAFKKGKTRMPKRLVFKEAIVDLGYPFEEEERFYVLQVALEKEQIDEVIKISETYKAAGMDGTVYAGNATNSFTAKHDVFRYEEHVDESVSGAERPRSRERVGREEIIRKEYINPPSDFLAAEAPPRSRSSRRAHSPSIESSISQRTSRSRARTVLPEPVYFEERKTVVEEREGSGALVPIQREHRSDLEIQAEIIRLEAERKALRLERGDEETQLALIREERPPRSEYSERERERSPPRNVIRVEKDRKGRMALVRSAH